MTLYNVMTTFGISGRKEIFPSEIGQQNELPKIQINQHIFRMI